MQDDRQLDKQVTLLAMSFIGIVIVMVAIVVFVGGAVIQLLGGWDALTDEFVTILTHIYSGVVREWNNADPLIRNIITGIVLLIMLGIVAIGLFIYAVYRRAVRSDSTA